MCLLFYMHLFMGCGDRGQKTICRSQTQVIKLGYKDLYMLMHLSDPRRLCVHVCVCEHACVFTGTLGCVHICGLSLSGVS